MHEAGLEAPTIILSNPPKWAVELYKTDKEKFFTAYQDYVEQVKDSLAQTGGEKNSLVEALFRPVRKSSYYYPSCRCRAHVSY